MTLFFLLIVVCIVVSSIKHEPQSAAQPQQRHPRKLFKKVWYNPDGTVYSLFQKAINEPHLLIAGATGSGKSVVIDGLITTALYNAPCEAKFILIDPKKVSLRRYKDLPHVLRYADNHGDICDAMEYAESIMDKRFSDMAARGLLKYDGPDLYIFIDELMDLMTTTGTKSSFKPTIQRIAQLGRAAKVHVIAATQSPIRDVIPSPVLCNFDARFALRTRDSQDARNIIGVKNKLYHLEDLPKYGQGLYMSPDEETLYKVPMVDDIEIERLINHWMMQK